jgi:hypothetical protein
MPRLTLSYPRLSVAVSASEAIVPLLRDNFRAALAPGDGDAVVHQYDAAWDGSRGVLCRDGDRLGEFADPTALMFALEEDLEVLLISRLGNWIGMHAGSVALQGRAIITVGHPDTGKTTTTMQLIELGLTMLSEEVTPIDPDLRLVHPFPHNLTLARHYAEAFSHLYPVTRGVLTYPGADMARYAPHATHGTPATPIAFLFPAYHPDHTPRLAEVSPADVLTELLQYCFAPHTGDEQLYDSVIRVVERCRVFRLQTNSIESARALLGSVITRLQVEPPAPALRPTSSP